MMLNREIGAKDMRFGPTAEEKRWAARKQRLFAAMDGSAEDVYDFENWHHPALLKGEVRRNEAAVKQALALFLALFMAAITTTTAEGCPVGRKAFISTGSAGILNRFLWVATIFSRRTWRSTTKRVWHRSSWSPRTLSRRTRT